jgi:Zn-dependent protease with chaperone function
MKLVLRVCALAFCVYFLPRSLAQELQMPNDYAIDLQLGMASRPQMMKGGSEIVGTEANQVGDEVFHHLVAAGFSQPYPWKLTLVNSDFVNAGSTAGGQVYVYGGILTLIGNNKGLWAAVISHETAHTGRRHQVRVYLQQIYIQQMIAYYRARANAGDKSANWALAGFAVSSKLLLKKMEREQEHDADQQGMLLMARAGYHPDYVFALHHLLLARTGEQSKFAAFFSDHPRWETRDQRSENVYADALAEYNRLWTDPMASPGGVPPTVAFLGHPEARENKNTEMADISIPMYCRNAVEPVDVVLIFQKDNRPIQAADPKFAGKDGALVAHDKVPCSDKDDSGPGVVHVPATAVYDHDRSTKAVVVVGSQGQMIAESKPFNVHFPKQRKHK